MMKSKLLGPTSNEWFNFGNVDEMKSTNDGMSFTNSKGTVTAKLGNGDGKFESFPASHTGSNVSTIQRVKVETTVGEDGLKSQLTTWELLFDDKHRETFQTSVKAKTKYDVLSNPMVWDFK